MTSPRRLAAESALQDAARKVFADKGYLNAKIADITELAGKSTGSFYTCYETKQQLLEAMLADFPQQVITRAVNELTDDWRANVETAVRVYFTTFREYLPEMVGVFHLSMTDAGAADWWRRHRAHGIAAVLGLIEAVEQAGVIVDLDRDVFASAMVSMLQAHCWTWMATAGDDITTAYDEDTAIRTIAAIWQRALSGAEG